MKSGGAQASLAPRPATAVTYYMYIVLLSSFKKTV